MRILNSIIHDGSTSERDRNTNRSTSLHNLHLHTVGSDSKSLSLSLRTLHDASTRPSRNFTTTSDQSPLWTALTTTVQINIEDS